MSLALAVPHFVSRLRAAGLAALLVSVGPALPAQEPATVATPSADQSWLAPVAAYLSEHYRTEGEWTLDLVRPFSPPSDAIVEVAEMPPAPASQMMLRLRIHDLEGRTSDVTVFVRVQIWRDAWIAREPLPRGGAVESHLVEMRRVDALRQRDLIPADAPLEELMVSRGLPAGRFVTWRDVVRRPLVRRGQMIDVAAVDGPLAVNMKALALQDGAAGELVRVRNVESRREFAALVTASGQAQVQF